MFNKKKRNNKICVKKRTSETQCDLCSFYKVKENCLLTYWFFKIVGITSYNFGPRYEIFSVLLW